MFYTLMEKGMLKKIKIYIGSGCRFGLYSNKQISYQGQPKVIAKSNNSSLYIKQICDAACQNQALLENKVFFKKSTIL